MCLAWSLCEQVHIGDLLRVQEYLTSRMICLRSSHELGILQYEDLRSLFLVTLGLRSHSLISENLGSTDSQVKRSL